MYDWLHRLKLVDGLLAAGLGLMTVGIGYNLQTKLTNPRVELIKGKVTPTVVQVDSKVVFDISGEVVKPGVYKLAKGSRIQDGLVAAGGLAANADRDWVAKNINLAKIIGDGEKIYIPRRQLTQSGGQAQVLGSQSQIININTAGIDELDKLSGVGPAIAQRIIDYRDKSGGFKDVNEIKMVSGVGDILYEKIKEQIGI